ncbi:MAG TPA: hypothetical protein P5114_08795 [Hyphomicrobiaceae bacterium]|nr:hypothetical protein [Hyphomicrobiaceae bacterium]
MKTRSIACITPGGRDAHHRPAAARNPCPPLKLNCCQVAETAKEVLPVKMLPFIW